MVTVPNPVQTRPDPLTRAAGGIDRLAAELGHWDARDRYQPGTGRRHPRAEASSAIDTIDHITAALVDLRNQLVTEVRRFDDQHNAATDELLARLRAEREATR